MIRYMYQLVFQRCLHAKCGESAKTFQTTTENKAFSDPYQRPLLHISSI